MGIIYGLLFIFTFLFFISIFEGNSIGNTSLKAWNSSKKSFVVLRIFILIGAITSSWMISGTIPTIVYYGLKFMNPSFYYLSAFLICCIVSFLLGSSFGTVGTVGIVLITIGRGLNVDINIAAGAILSGAFFGDRCSPVSSSASLIATLTETDIYKNIKNMTKTGIFTLFITCVIYVVIPKPSIFNLSESNLIPELKAFFNTSFFTLIPALVILVCGIFKVNVRKSMIISIIAACLNGVFLQGENIITILKTIIVGYSFPNGGELALILKGGGIISMVKASFIVFISCALSGILDNIKLFNKLKNSLIKIRGKAKVFATTSIVSGLSAGIGCNQSISVVLSETLMNDVYKENKLSNEELALHLENTAIVISPLIPWNIASLIPMTIIGVTGLSYLKYSFFLYLLPIVTFIWIFSKKREY